MKSVINSSRFFLFGLLAPLAAFAEEHAASATSGGAGGVALAAAIAVALAAFGGALGQGKIAAAYMDGASRNPQAVSVMKTQLILSLIFVETLVLFSLLIALTLAGKV
ncbi:ATP synthase F0 subunit C [bacterium]|nr:ATP synthase F0 subunit C [bacterium]